MAFGDRGRYKSLATAFHSLLPDLYASIEGFPRAASVPGFPTEAVAIHPMSNATQLIWLKDGLWRSWILLERPDGTSEHLPIEVGPKAAELPARWAMGHTLRLYEDWLAQDEPAEQERLKDDRVSLTRVFVEDMSARVRRLLMT